ncbi:hypothetical protein N431DRAFT_454737 [Stipitochalara longipes BDJ]|nr:hypothetical protein N431DRAFT_454737 [Stipitochalara longipes BDJ]
MASAEFILFPKFSKEIRDMIWKFAIPGPRVVNIFLRQCKTPEQRLHPEKPIRPKAESVTPAMLHTCRESRQIALQSYQPAFEEFLRERPVYFDWSRDYLYFDEGETFLESCFAERVFHHEMELSEACLNWQKKLRHMAIGADIGECEEDRMNGLGGLETLLLVSTIDHKDELAEEGVEFSSYNDGKVDQLQVMWGDYLANDRAKLPEIRWIDERDIYDVSD